VIEFQLAHLDPNETRRAYNRAQYWDQRVQMMQDWADMIAELREGTSSLSPGRVAATVQP
jgi:hypothetical protein